VEGIDQETKATEEKDELNSELSEFFLLYLYTKGYMLPSFVM
jgi:DNA polymerase sigma